MAGNDTAALVVALSAQLTKFEKDMKGAVDIADKRSKEIETRFSSLNKVASDQFSKFSANATGNIGALGSALVALGPAGIAAAVALGLATGGVLFLVNATEEFADKSKRLVEAAESAGLTITALKLLGQVGRTVGLDFDESSALVTQFIARLRELRDGGGPLYDALLKIDAGLLRQLSVTKDSAKAIDILAAAFGRLKTQTDKLDLAKAASGRAGVSGVQFFDELANRGGATGVVAQGPKIDEEQIRRARDLKNEIEDIRGKTSNIWGSMFSDFILGQQKLTAENLNAIARAISNIVESQTRRSSPENLNEEEQAQKLKFLLERQRDLNEQLERQKKIAENPSNPFAENAAAQATIIAERLVTVNAEIDKIKGKAPVQIIAPPSVDVPLPTPRPAGAPGSPSVELGILQKHISLLGEAVNAGELWKEMELKIAAAVEKDKTVTEIANRIRSAGTLVIQAAALAARERLGVATEQEIVETKLAQLEQERTKFSLTANEVQKATVVIMKEAKLAAEALAVRQSYLPGLKQLQFDAASLSKNLDAAAVSSVNNLGTALGDIVTRSATASDAFRNLGLQVVRSVTDMIIKMTILAPIAKALQDILSGLGGGIPLLGGLPIGQGGIGARAGGGPVQAGMPYIIGENGPELMVPQSPGMVLPNDALRQSGRSDARMSIAVNISGARGNREIQAAMHAGMTQAIGQSAAMIRDFSVNHLPGRMNEISRDIA